MKDELNKKIRELCNEAGSAAACAMAPVLTEDLGRKYDERVAAGMSELDAYRDVLRSVDRIEAMLRALPKDAPASSGTSRTAPSSRTAPETADGGYSFSYSYAKKAYAAGAKRSAPEVRPSTPEEEEAVDLENGRKRLKFLVEKTSGMLWVGTTLLYFLWSFAFGGWRYTWLIFLWATLGQIVLSGAEEYNSHRNLRKTLHSVTSGCLWIGAVLAFFLIGFGLHRWRLSWLVFLAATLAQILLETFLPDK